MSDSDDNKPVQKRPQPRPRAKRSKIAPNSTSTSSPNSTLSPRADSSGANNRSSGTLADNYSERVEDDFFNRASVSFREIHKIQGTCTTTLQKGAKIFYPEYHTFSPSLSRVKGLDNWEHNCLTIHLSRSRNDRVKSQCRVDETGE